MFISALIKSVATVTVVGGVLAAAQVAVPAAATDTAQTKSAAIGGCTYPSRVQTTTSLTLRRTTGQYGAHNTANVTVRPNSNTAATPRGNARITVAGDTYGERLSGGSASIALPRGLSAGDTYRVTATYRPSSCSQFKPSSSAGKFYQVTKAGTTASATARDIARGDRPRVRVLVTSATGMEVRSGQVRVRLFKNGDLKQSHMATINNGEAAETFGRVFARGAWDVKVAYFGTSNFQGDGAATSFRVTRN